MSACQLVTDGTRLYKTGDLARYLPDGTLVFVGRRDGQLKLRGFRIELGEVEAALRAHPSVALAAVLARSDRSLPSAAPVLVAYVVPATTDHRPPTTDDGRPTIDDGSASEPSSIVHRPSSLADELRAFLRSRLPAYMLPAQFVLREALPLNRSGKLDRKALAAELAPALPPSFVAPRNELEARVAAVWAEVLGREAISVEEDFFALGGHSLLATQVLARLRESERVELAVRDLFREPTVAGLAASIAALQWAAQAAPRASSPDDEREEIEL